MNEQMQIHERHWRKARGCSLAARFDARRFDGLVKLVVSVQRRAAERQLSQAERDYAEWMRQERRAA